MLLVSTHFWARPSWHFAKNMLYKGENISQIRTRAACSNVEAPVGVILNPHCKFWNNVINSEMFNGKKILYFASSSSDIFAPLSKVYFNGAKIAEIQLNGDGQRIKLPRFRKRRLSRLDSMCAPAQWISPKRSSALTARTIRFMRAQTRRAMSSAMQSRLRTKATAAKLL